MERYQEMAQEVMEFARNREDRPSWPPTSYRMEVKTTKEVTLPFFGMTALVEIVDRVPYYEYHRRSLPLMDEKLWAAIAHFTKYMGAQGLRFEWDNKNVARFSPELMRIGMPDRHHFVTDVEFVSTYGHEITHASDHRMYRRDEHRERAFGEMIADFGAALFLHQFGIATEMRWQNKNYIVGWLNGDDVRQGRDPEDWIDKCLLIRKAALIAHHCVGLVNDTVERAEARLERA